MQFEQPEEVIYHTGEQTEIMPYELYKRLCLNGLMASVKAGKMKQEDANRYYDQWFPGDTEGTI